MIEIAVVHILDNARSPVDQPTWYMHCGMSTLVHENGDTDPDIDFVDEAHPGKATCEACVSVRQ